MESTNIKYKVYKINSKEYYYGTALVAALSEDEANKYIEEFKKSDKHNDYDSGGYSYIKETDAIEHIWSDIPGIIAYGIYYSG